MPEYRKVFLEGGMYFITIITYRRVLLLNNSKAGNFSMML